MTLKEELEILRGEPIELLPKPEEIPCVETSDSEKLCKHPVVSIHMITYNHEPYIRQAIEGVMMQKTDFEFELIIGEDCSQDKTREICFEYQKRHPDKIRVLWSEHNVNVGPNLTRVATRCRGEFIAYCEGDDYWIDSLKLQKQVDVMRRYPNVGLCYTDVRDHFMSGAIGKQLIVSERLKMPKGVIPGAWFCRMAILGRDLKRCGREWSGTPTPSVLIRRDVAEEAGRRYGILGWRLNLGDLQRWISTASLSDVYFLPEDCTRYHVTSTGALGTLRQRVHCDGVLVRLYFFNKLLGFALKDYPPAACDDLIMEFVKSFTDKKNFPERSSYFGRLKFILSCLRNESLRPIWLRPSTVMWIGFCLINYLGHYPFALMRRLNPLVRAILFLHPKKELRHFCERIQDPASQV